MRLVRLLLGALLPIALQTRAKDANFESLLQDTRPAPLNTPIPRIVHFIYGLKGPSEGDVDFFHYLAVKSAREAIKPDHLWFWVHFEPSGPNWNAIKEIATIRRTDLIDSVYGNPIKHFAHRADVLRLKVLHEFGGIYLDLDVLSLRSFDDLLHYPMVMGQEGMDGNIGLCNGVIVSQPRAPFLRRWMESYSSFNGTVWAWHSVAIPSHLSKIHPAELRVLDYDAFFWPLWNEPGLQKLYMQKTSDFSKNYAVHLWESNAKHWFLNQFSPQLIQNVDLPIFCQMRRFLFNTTADEKDCALAKENKYGDGIVSYYRFDDDSAKPEALRDSLGNRLHGWAINGTSLVTNSDGSGISRAFHGSGDFAILPVPEDFTLGEFTVQFRVNFDAQEQAAASVLAIQSQIFTVLVECTSEGNYRRPWLKVHRTFQTETPVVDMQWLGSGDIVADNWATLIVRASAKEGRLELLANNQTIARSVWPPAMDQGQQLDSVSNIWLGARPASPFPEPRRKEILNDFLGLMDDIMVFDKYVPSSSLLAASQDPMQYYYRHRELMHVNPSDLAVNIDLSVRSNNVARMKLPSSDAITWTDAEAFKPTYPLILPMQFKSVLPLHSRHWTVSWTMQLTYRFQVGQLQSEPSPAESFVEVSFDDGQLVGVTHDTVTGNLLVKQWGFGWPAFHQLSAQSACSMKMGYSVPVHFALSMNADTGAVHLSCNGFPIFYKRFPFTQTLRNPALTQVSSTAEMHGLQMRLGSHSDAHLKQADLMLENKPGFSATCLGESVAASNLQKRQTPFPLPYKALQIEPLTLYIEESARLLNLQPSLTLDTSNSKAFLTKKPSLIATSLSSNSFRIDANDLECGGEDDAEVELTIPEVFARFRWKIACDASLSQTIPRDHAVFSDKTHVRHKAKKISRASQSSWLLCIGVVLLFAKPVARGFKVTPPESPVLPSKRNSISMSKASINLYGEPLGPLRTPSSIRRSRFRWTITLGFWCLVLLLLYSWQSQPDNKWLSPHFNVSPFRRILPSSLKSMSPTESHASMLKNSTELSKVQEANNLLADINSARSHRESGARRPPIISIVTPCYQQRSFLEETSRFVLEQSYPHWEWIIIDDGSPDGCFETGKRIQQRHPTRAIRVYTKETSGLANSRNVGISLASGDWICLLDADDGLDASYFEQASQAIMQNSSITAVNANQQFFGESDWVFRLEAHNKNAMLYKGLFPVQTIFRKEDWLRVKGFDPSLPWGDEDWSFWISLSFLPDFAVHKLPGELLLYRFKQGSMQREKETHPEAVSLLMTLHPDKYSPDELKLAHTLIARWGSLHLLHRLEAISERFPNRRGTLLWRGIIAEHAGQYDEAVALYERSLALLDNGQTDWQPVYRIQEAQNKMRAELTAHH